MKNVVIISEYNLFHNGHKRQYEKLREQYSHEGCRIIAVMSGNYTQRGIVALLPKYKRAEIAIREGADLVLELPFPWSCAPAEIFAGAGVHIASSVGADILCFGSESGDAGELKKSAARLSSPELHSRLELARTEAAHSGESFIKTRERVYTELYGEPPSRLANDILGVEYMRAVSGQQSSLEPYVMLREGEETATSARKYALSGEPGGLAGIAPATLCEAVAAHGVADLRKFETAVLSFFRLTPPSELAGFADMSYGLACRMCGAAREADTLEGYFAACATKKYTGAQLRRCTLYCMLRVSAERLKRLPPYTVLLAANADGCAFLAETKGRRAIPVISRAANLRELDATAREAFDFAGRADSFYELLFPGDIGAAPFIAPER